MESVNFKNKKLSTTKLTGFDLFHWFLLFPIYRNRTKSIDVTQISRDIYDAERAQDKANDDLEAASRNTDVARNQVADVRRETGPVPSASDLFKPDFSPMFQTINALTNTEAKLMSRRPEDLHQRIKDLQRKTEGNRNVASAAGDGAAAALETATGVEDVSVAQACVSVATSRQLFLSFLSSRR